MPHSIMPYGSILLMIYQTFAGGNPSPPGIFFRITDANELRITDDGNSRITD